MLQMRFSDVGAFWWRPSEAELLLDAVAVSANFDTTPANSTTIHWGGAGRVELFVDPNPQISAATAFVGAGENDLTQGGTYTGNVSATYSVQIVDAAVSPDTFRWNKDGGAWTAAMGIPGAGVAQTLSDGITVTFAAVDGHTNLDVWTITITVRSIVLRIESSPDDGADGYYRPTTANFASIIAREYVFNRAGEQYSILLEGVGAWGRIAYGYRGGNGTGATLTVRAQGKRGN